MFLGLLLSDASSDRFSRNIILSVGVTVPAYTVMASGALVANHTCSTGAPLADRYCTVLFDTGVV